MFLNQLNTRLYIFFLYRSLANAIGTCKFQNIPDKKRQFDVKIQNLYNIPNTRLISFTGVDSLNVQKWNVSKTM